MDRPAPPYSSIGLTPALVSFDCVTWFVVPDGMTAEEFIRSMTEDSP